ncbi:hypothetical protein [Lysinibacillus pakistanensis]|uniref:hypothetical protein n=1 Tax=Lysinibacillus pakistanensis TaxID=759811 RepID=UPI003D277462
MDYQVILNNNERINAKNISFEIEEVTTTLNDPKIIFVNIGDMVISKHNIIGIFPKAIAEGETLDEN